MARMRVVDRAGNETEIEATIGLSIMEILRGAGFGELLALCGGHCSCATCHIYIDDIHAPLLPAMSDEESDLLDGSAHREPRSRLACQIPFEAALDGLRIRIAPED